MTLAAPLIKYGSIAAPASTSNKPSWRDTNIPVLVVAFIGALATGAPAYSFGLYADQLKSSLHLSQSQLNMISSSTFIGGLVSWIPGMLVDKWGCRYGMIIGGTAQSVALASYWLAATSFASLHVSSSIAVFTLSILGIFTFMANALVIGSLFKAVVVNCGAGTRGTAVGVAKGYLGLGAGTYSCLFDALRKPTTSDLNFLLMASILALVCIAIPPYILLPNDFKNEKRNVAQVATSRHFLLVYFGLFVLALLVVGTSAVFLFQPLPQDYTTIPASDEPSLWRACCILVAWIGPIVSLLCLARHSSTSTSETDSIVLITSKSSVVDEDDDTEQDYTLWQVVHTATAWLLCWTCIVLVGSGTLMTNNMAQEIQALHFPARATSACLAMFSVSQSMSRVACGAVSEWACTLDTNLCGIHRGVPRPFFFILASAFGVVAHVILAFATSRSLFVLGVVVAGIAFGMVWPLMVLIVGEVYGKRNHGANYMAFDGTTCALGTLLISNVLASSVYEAHIDNDDELSCYGKGCYQLTHVIVAGLCVCCMATSTIIMIRTRDVYGQPTDQVMHRRITDELFGSPYMPARRKRVREDRHDHG